MRCANSVASAGVATPTPIEWPQRTRVVSMLRIWEDVCSSQPRPILLERPTRCLLESPCSATKGPEAAVQERVSEIALCDL